MKSEAHLTLFELNQLVRETIECEMPDEYWVEAELSECRESRGHCYMELIQYDEDSKSSGSFQRAGLFSAPARSVPIAKASAKCWASKWMVIRPYFERITGQQLHAGMKMLLKVYPQFHEAYGFSWIVTDIDPTYTIGDMARKRQEIIRQLKEEGIFDLQKELRIPLFCQHIAVISSETAAGYGDFCNQLTDNPYGFLFHTRLFPAIMQGEGTAQSIINALERIYACVNSEQDFDCVVIIRGGGATSDLSGFDTLELAENVANFPIPIITGIGHDRDESIIDMISHTRVKTPTAAAALLISHLKEVLDTINGAQERLTRYAQQKLSTANNQLSAMAVALPRIFSTLKIHQEAHIDSLYSRLIHCCSDNVSSLSTRLSALEDRLPMLVERRLLFEQHRLQLINEKTKGFDPRILLKRGYSITLHQGKVIRSSEQLCQGDEIETLLEKGTIKSIIK